MLTFLMILALGAHAPSAARPAAEEPRTLQCTAQNTRDGKDRKCQVKIPKERSVRSCDAAEKAAGHCALDANHVAWTAGENGARCELSTKKTNWTKRVAIKVAKATRPGAGRCTLFVGVR